jgi:hypothetical protein
MTLTDKVAEKWKALTPVQQKEVKRIANRGKLSIPAVLSFYKPKAHPRKDIS